MTVFDGVCRDLGVAPDGPPDSTYAIPLVIEAEPAPAPTATRYEPEPVGPACCCAQVLQRLDELETLIRGGVDEATRTRVR